MLANFSSVNLVESKTVWEAKESPTAILLGYSEAEVRMFRWEQKKKFTVLEDFVLKVIERGLGNSDEEIARVLCLETKDIAVIVEDNILKDEIEGDASHRSLPDNFTRRLPDGIALDSKGKTLPPKIEGSDSVRAEVIKLADTFGYSVKLGNLPQKRRQWMREKRARLFTLPVKAFHYKDETWVFLCGEKRVPPILVNPLSKLEAFKNLQDKSAPPRAVCHRSEFWQWLAHRLRETPPKRIAFECTKPNEQAMKWLCDEARIGAGVLHHHKKERQAVHLDGERFELHKDFICRAKASGNRTT